MFKKTSSGNLNRSILIALLSFLLFYMTGCFSAHKDNIKAFTMPGPDVLSVESYLLQPPDEIVVYCIKVPELHLHRQRIRPDGKVSYQGIGDIDAAGKTPEQLAEIIKDKALKLYSLAGDKPIDVRVTKFESKVYYVLGQVNRPGPKNLTGRDTVLSAVAEAGFIPRSWEERVQVIRPSGNKNIEPKVFEVNVDQMIAHGDTSKNVLLQEGDIVFVPPTIFGAVGLAIEELLAPVRQVFSTVNVATGTPGPR